MRFQFWFTILLLLLTSSVWAARDPISWSLSNSFENPVIVGRSSSVTYTFTSQLPAAMTKALSVMQIANPSSDFSLTDNCTNQKLTPNQSCTVQVTLLPSTTGTKSTQLRLSGYDNNILNIPSISTTAAGDAIPGVYGKVTNQLPSSVTAGTSQSYSFQFTNSGGTAVSNVSLNVTQTSGTPTFSTSCGSTLLGSCTVIGQYTATNTPSVQTVSAQLSYGSGSSVSVSTSTNVTAATGVTASFVDSEYLPAVMVPGTQVIDVLFTNNTGGSVVFGANTTPMTITQGGGLGSVSVTLNSCQNVTLPNNAACEVKGTLTANSAGQITVQTTANYTGGPGTTSISTSTTVVNSLSTNRTLTIVNNCSFPVYFSLNGGAYPTATSCTTNTDCEDGSHNQVGSCAGGTCYFKNYVPNSPGSGGNAYKLDAAGGGVTQNTFTLLTNTFTNQSDQLWSGNISASLNCSGTSCLIADCGNQGGTTGCAVGQGFSQPATQAEFTLLRSSNDSYDVEVINGFTLPISMAPNAPVNIDGYTCGTAADPVAENGFGSCNWSTAAVPAQKQFPSSTTLAGNGYYRVTSGGAACNINTGLTTGGGSCTAGTVCGLDSSLNQSCGNFLGYWTADEVCGKGSSVPSAVSSYFMCAAPLPALAVSQGLSSSFFPTNSVLSQIMLCAVPKGDTNYQYNTCYATYSGVPSNNQISCCGCIDWWTIAGVNSNSTAQSCTQGGQSSPQTDPVWNQYIQYGVQWMKKACPSAYTYPFDDATSGFSCTNTLPNQPNSTNYTITFCPGSLVPNNTGLPSGVNEGRTN